MILRCIVFTVRYKKCNLCFYRATMVSVSCRLTWLVKRRYWFLFYFLFQPMNVSTGVSGRSSNANDKIDNVNDNDDCSNKDSSNNDNGNDSTSNTDDSNDNCKEDGNKVNNVQDSNSSNNSNNGNSSKIEKGGKKNDSTVTWTLPSSTVSNTKSQDGGKNNDLSFLHFIRDSI